MLGIADFSTFGVLFQIMTAAHDIIKCTLKVYLVADEKNAIPQEFLGKLQASENLPRAVISSHCAFIQETEPTCCNMFTLEFAY